MKGWSKYAKQNPRTRMYLVKTISAFEELHSKSFDNFLLEKKISETFD